MRKSILFLSAIDFKEKSIQVIKKTPEAYAESGWDVYYIVARDNSKYGNYFYEKVINPHGVKVIRFEWPFSYLRNKISNKKVRTIISKIAGYFVILKLAYLAFKLLRKEKIDVIYAYETHGVLAAAILKILGIAKQQKIVHRFQGTWINYYLKKRKFLKLIFNWEHILALWLKSDLCIMTDDGTQGKEVMEKIKSRSLQNLKFWPNGVDEIKLPKEEILKLRKKYGVEGKWVFLTTCRLVSWKRVDRALKVISLLKRKYKIDNFFYFIIGDGPERHKLQRLVKDLHIQDKVVFAGALPHSRVKEYLNIADFIILTYDLSNVGNPLLEAIRANKIIFTLNNGDTSEWIKHKFNGFIYNIDETMYEKMAKDIVELIRNSKLRKKIILNIKKTEREKLWTWQERLRKEVEEVYNLIRSK